MQKWEYKKVNLEERDPWHSGTVEEDLNAFGQEGWELVYFARFGTSDSDFVATLKRPVAEECCQGTDVLAETVKRVMTDAIRRGV